MILQANTRYWTGFARGALYQYAHFKSCENPVWRSCQRRSVWNLSNPGSLPHTVTMKGMQYIRTYYSDVHSCAITGKIARNRLFLGARFFTSTSADGPSARRAQVGTAVQSVDDSEDYSHVVEYDSVTHHGEDTTVPSSDGVDELQQAISRPPPVNSSYLPLPWRGRLGYVSHFRKNLVCLDFSLLLCGSLCGTALSQHLPTVFEPPGFLLKNLSHYFHPGTPPPAQRSFATARSKEESTRSKPAGRSSTRTEICRGAWTCQCEGSCKDYPLE